MATVGVARLKARLSAFLARVRSGEEIVVTDRGVPVARIVAIRSAGDDDEKRLERLERDGKIRRGRGELPPGFFDLPRPSDARGLVRRALIEEREEGR